MCRRSSRRCSLTTFAICEHSGIWLSTPYAPTAPICEICFSHLDRLGIDSLAKVDLRALRSWLAKQHTIGHARTTLQRRAAAARVFFAWAQESGGIAADPAAKLRSPKATRILPPTLEQATAARMLDEAIATAREAGGPVAARDVAAAGVVVLHRNPGLRALRSRPR